MKKFMIPTLVVSSLLLFTACGGGSDYPDEPYIPTEDDFVDETGYDEQESRVDLSSLPTLLQNIAGSWVEERPGVFTLEYDFNTDYTYQWSSDGGAYTTGTFELVDDSHFLLHDDGDGSEKTFEYAGDNRIVDDEGAVWIPYGTQSYEEGHAALLDDVNYKWRYEVTDNYDEYYNLDSDGTWYLTLDSGESKQAYGTYEYDGENLIFFEENSQSYSYMTYSSDEGQLIDENGNHYIIFGPADN